MMSMNPETSLLSTTTENPEWNRLWQVVRNEPNDFNSWEQLIRVAEATEGGFTKTSPPENITRLENVYDSFLAKFPLCFGYWKKYADWELAARGDESAEKIFERGVAAIHNSIDLWNQYIDFKLSRSTPNDEMESLFERAGSSVGLDFLAHPFWDKYLEFVETRLADSKRVLELLDRIVLIPMHQYARYYEKWRNMRANMSPTEALNPRYLEQFTEEINAEKGPLEPSELQVALKEKLDNQTASVYKTTQDGTNKRWVYEAEIKRSYFHVKPLDRPQLQNWSKYLDFEESQQDITRIHALYERCLVPCAQYEEFWLRYGEWLTKNSLLEEAKHAYEKASRVFLSPASYTVKIALALIQEEQGLIEEARKTFTDILESKPTHVESILNYIHFERRQNPSSFEGIINTYIHSTELNEASKAFFTVQYARYLQNNNQTDKAREVYSSSVNQYAHSRYFWINYINFELGFYDQHSNERIMDVFEKSCKTLPKELQTTINIQYKEYLLERGNSVVPLNRSPLPVSTEFTSNVSHNATPTTTSLKRPAQDDNNNFNYAKQARFDTHTPQQYGTYSQPTPDYYNQQPWQG